MFSQRDTLGALCWSDDIAAALCAYDVEFWPLREARTTDAAGGSEWEYGGDLGQERYTSPKPCPETFLWLFQPICVQFGSFLGYLGGETAPIREIRRELGTTVSHEYNMFG